MREMPGPEKLPGVRDRVGECLLRWDLVGGPEGRLQPVAVNPAWVRGEVGDNLGRLAAIERLLASDDLDRS
jgi:hypothetical protein